MMGSKHRCRSRGDKPSKVKPSGARGRKRNRPSSPIPVNDKINRVGQLLRGLTFILKHHGCPKGPRLSFYKQAWDYLNVEKEEVYIARAKHMMLWPMARYLKNEYPKEPDCVLVFGGSYWRWARQRLHHYCRRNTHLWYSFLQGKRAAAPVTQEFVLETFRKHREQMGQKDPIDRHTLQETMDLLDPVLRELGAGLQCRKDLEDLYEPEHPASLRAAYCGPRSRGGQRSVLRYAVCGGFIDRFESDTELWSMTHWTGLVRLKSSLTENPVFETRFRPSLRSEFKSQLKLFSFYTTRHVAHLRCQIEAVIEPLKVRTISKGEAFQYYLGKKWQKALHSEMRRLPEFRLIGRPFRATDLMDLKDSYSMNCPFQGMGGENPSWLSIDYSAATDGLSAALSAAIQVRLLNYSGLIEKDENFSAVILKTLLPHVVEYPCMKEEVVSLVRDQPFDEKTQQYLQERWQLQPTGQYRINQRPEPVLQMNGQLMGSITSFPILCLANLGLYLLVRARTRPDWDFGMNRRTVLINGDDMLYPGNRKEWDLHISLGERVGLRQSPGKAYFHPRYANVNSMCVDYPRNGTPRLIPFLNVGLFFGNHKVLAKVGPDGPEESRNQRPFSTVFDKVVEGAWNGKQEEIAKAYLNCHKGDLRDECRGRNLFLPVSVGGMGVSPWLEPRITPKQWRIANGLFSQPGVIPGERPLPYHTRVRVADSLQRELEPLEVPKELPVEKLPLGHGSRFPGFNPAFGLAFGVLPS